MSVEYKDVIVKCGEDFFVTTAAVEDGKIFVDEEIAAECGNVFEVISFEDAVNPYMIDLIVKSGLECYNASEKCFKAWVDIFQTILDKDGIDDATKIEVIKNIAKNFLDAFGGGA